MISTPSLDAALPTYWGCGPSTFRRGARSQVGLRAGLDRLRGDVRRGKGEGQTRGLWWYLHQIGAVALETIGGENGARLGFVPVPMDWAWNGLGEICKCVL